MLSQRLSLYAVFAVATVSAVASCDQRPGRNDTGTSTTTEADNTARNQRDVDTGAPTPIDQGESEADRTITADIRKAVMAREELSVNAKNCKIITKSGVVTLRGPVGSAAEKQWIETRAKETAGVTGVLNELEVAG